MPALGIGAAEAMQTLGRSSSATTTFGSRPKWPCTSCDGGVLWACSLVLAVFAADEEVPAVLFAAARPRRHLRGLGGHGLDLSTGCPTPVGSLIGLRDLGGLTRCRYRRDIGRRRRGRGVRP